MALPLVALGALSVVGGGLNLPLSRRTEVLGRWLEPVFGVHLHEVTASTGTKWALFVVTIVAVAVGIATAYNVFLRRARIDALEPAALQRGWYVDATVAALVDGPVRMAAAWSAYVVDRRIIDGAVNGIGSLVRGTGAKLRTVQSGFVRNYALAVVAGAVVLLGYAITRVAAG
jgi:NADH-quinone oxidoreductase subunit L